MKKYTLSDKQIDVVSCWENEVKFRRGTGATFAVAYGALKWAEENPDSNIVIFTHLAGMNDISRKIEELNPKVTSFHYPSGYVTTLVTGILKKHISTIVFKDLNKIENQYGEKYDLAYIDATQITEKQGSMLPFIASYYCAVTSYED